MVGHTKQTPPPEARRWVPPMLCDRGGETGGIFEKKMLWKKFCMQQVHSDTDVDRYIDRCVCIYLVSGERASSDVYIICIYMYVLHIATL